MSDVQTADMDVQLIIEEGSTIQEPSTEIFESEENKLALIDIDVKTSKATLAESLDLLIIRELE